MRSGNYNRHTRNLCVVQGWALTRLRLRSVEGASSGVHLDFIRGVVFAEHAAYRVGDFAERRVGAHRVDNRRHQVGAVARDFLDACERLLRGLGVAPGADAGEPLLLLPLDCGVYLQDVAGQGVARGEFVDADDDAILGLDFALVNEGRVLDLALHIAALDRGHRAAEVVDLFEVLARLLFEFAGERFDVPGAAERVDRIGHTRLVSNNLLGAQCEQGGGLARKRQRLVARIGVERLRAAEHRGQRLERNADDVVIDLLRGEARACRLRMEAHHHRALVLRAEAVLHDARPQVARRAVLGDFLEEVVVHVEEEGEAAREVVDFEARLDGGFDVGDAVGDREGEFLRGGRAGFADVVAGDRDRVPVRNLFGRVLENVGDDAHRTARRINIRAAGDVFLEDVVLDGAVELAPRDVALLGDDEIEREQNRGGRVDGHRGGDLVERKLGEQRLHVVERADRDADAADFAGGEFVVGVAAHLGRQVEGDREAGLAVGEEVTIAAVGFLGVAEAGVLAHRPEPPAIHRGLHAAREGVFAGEADIVEEIEILDVIGLVSPLDFDSGSGGEALAALGPAFERRLELLFRPFVAGGFDSAIVAWHWLPASVYSITTRTSPFSTVWPGATLTSATLPSLGDLSSFSIFIASTTTTPC